MTNDEIAAARAVAVKVRRGQPHPIADTIEALCDEVERLQRSIEELGATIWRARATSADNTIKLMAAETKLAAIRAVVATGITYDWHCADDGMIRLNEYITALEEVIDD